MQKTIFQGFVVPVAVSGLLLASLLSVREHWAEDRRANLVAEEGEARAYVARRRMECYDIYTRERAQFSNIEVLNYDHVRDRCEIIYGYSGSKETNLACRLTRALDSIPSTMFWLRMEWDCENNRFRKEF
ncbi:hypothetical protein LCGC14_0757850 [marine sediment metagenome]|uniref:Uncharacterized protein n=1 Tax=marine sediment metagenome TaxID=412755 RepID=A0A0F9Q262_9ZZZZ